MAIEKAKRNKEIYDKYTGTFSEDGRLYSQRELQREYGFKSQKSIYRIVQREEARRSPLLSRFVKKKSCTT